MLGPQSKLEKWRNKILVGSYIYTKYTIKKVFFSLGTRCPQRRENLQDWAGLLLRPRG
jgi:hypothetical protein